MRSHGQHWIRIFEVNPRAVTIALTLRVLFALVAVLIPAAQAQTYNVVHNFTSGQDGATPKAGVTIDAAGNLYGTAFAGGSSGVGTVYELKYKDPNFVFNLLYSFAGDSDGAHPEARVIFGPDGLLYGTTLTGNCCGRVFSLRPSPTACKAVLCPWTETAVYIFQGDADGSNPGFGDLIFYEGSIYGTTIHSNTGCNGYGCGVVFDISSIGSEKPLYDFGGPDGAFPFNGVIFDAAGNLYGTTFAGGPYNNCPSYLGITTCGTVFQWSGATGESVLYGFSSGSDGSSPIAGLTFDGSGNNLYGATSNGGPGGGGVVFELSTPGTWDYSVLYSFTGGASGNCPAITLGYGGPGPWASLSMDTAGNLYGTTVCDGAYGYGSVFMLTPTPTPPWTYTSLHDFCAGGPPCSDGAYPISNVTLHYNTNGMVDALYGTASAGGSQGEGVVWEITP